MKKLLPVFLCVMAFASCKKSSEDFQTAALSDYAPYTIGKYITYDLDSLVYTNFGATEEHHFYQAKFMVADTFRDNLNRKGYRITRYIKPQTGGTFTPDNTFTAINAGTSLEFVENNLRYIKLVQPVKDGGTWKGNSFIDAFSAGASLDYLDDWDYTYENVDQSAKIGAVTFANTVTVNQRDLSDGLPITGATQYAQRDLSNEIYIKGIGLGYRKFLHFEYQGGAHTYEGYGVTYTMVDHN